MAMSIIAPDIGLDLGSSNTLMCVKGRRVTIDEPTLVVTAASDKRMVRAVGEEASDLLGRTTDQLTAIHPVVAGIVDDFDSTEVLVRYFMRKAIGVSHLMKPRVLCAVPTDLPAVNRKALVEAVTIAGARRKAVYMVDKPLCAALGSGLNAYDPSGLMIVDIGGGTTSTAVISLGGVVVSQTIQVGGDQMDMAIVSYLKKNSSVVIGQRTAEVLKKDLASALPTKDERSTRIRGRDLFSAHAMSVEFTAAQAYDAVREPCAAILQSIKWVLERTPPELAADIMRGGIHLTGGGSQLFAMDQFIASNVGIPVMLAVEPEYSTIQGISFLLDNADLFDAIARKNLHQ